MYIQTHIHTCINTYISLIIDDFNVGFIIKVNIMKWNLTQVYIYLKLGVEAKKSVWYLLVSLHNNNDDNNNNENLI